MVDLRGAVTSGLSAVCCVELDVLADRNVHRATKSLINGGGLRRQDNNSV